MNPESLLSKRISGTEWEHLDKEKRSRLSALVGHAFLLVYESSDEVKKNLRRFSRYSDGYLANVWVPSDLAFVLGTLIHSRAQDDTFASARTHVTACALPSIIATSLIQPKIKVSDILQGLLAAFEAVAVVGANLGDAVGKRGIRASTIFGPLAAAAGTARTLNLRPEQISSALGIASSFAGGTSETWAGGEEWRFGPGFAAATGWRSTILALGTTKPAPAWLTGPNGLWASYADYDGGEILNFERKRGEVLEEIRSKPFPVCEINQNLVLAAHRLGQDVCPTTQNTPPKEMNIYLNPADADASPLIDRRGPFDSWTEAMMSVQYCASVSMRYGSTALESMEVIPYANLSRWIDRIRVVREESIRRGTCRIEMVTATGTSHKVSSRNDFLWQVSNLEQALERSTLERADVDALMKLLTEPKEHSALSLLSVFDRWFSRDMSK